MLIIGADDGNLRLACEACGAHTICPGSFRFWALRCHVCGEIGEIHSPRTRMSASRSASPIGEGPWHTRGLASQRKDRWSGATSTA
jgi:hypothetical protein